MFVTVSTRRDWGCVWVAERGLRRKVRLIVTIALAATVGAMIVAQFEAASDRAAGRE